MGLSFGSSNNLRSGENLLNKLDKNGENSISNPNLSLKSSDLKSNIMLGKKGYVRSKYH